MFTKHTQSQGHQVVKAPQDPSSKEEKIRLAKLREQAHAVRPQNQK